MSLIGHSGPRAEPDSPHSMRSPSSHRRQRVCGVTHSDPLRPPAATGAAVNSLLSAVLQTWLKGGQPKLYFPLLCPVSEESAAHCPLRPLKVVMSASYDTSMTLQRNEDSYFTLCSLGEAWF